MRTKLRVYRLKKDLCVATGKALAQDPEKFGSGGATQYYIEKADRGALAAKGTRPI